jgi:hypothetical protein
MAAARHAVILAMLLLPSICAQGSAAENVRIIDDGDTEFAKSGTWSRVQVVIPNIAYNDDFVQAGPAASPGKATWTMYVNPGVRYRVSIVWHTPSIGAVAYSPAAPVKVLAGGTQLVSKTLNMQKAPNDLNADGLIWENLGDFQINANPVKVELTGVSDKTVLADAVRIERLDGRPIFSPAIEEVVPKPVFTSGNVQVRMLGSDFDPAARFFVNGVAMTNTVFVSPTEMRATIPPQPAGLQSVMVVSGAGLRHTLPGALHYGDILYLDDGEPGFDTTGNWGYARSTLPNHAYNADFRQGAPAASGSFASWTFAVLPDEYLVSIAWPAYSAPYNLSYSTAAKFSVWDGNNRVASVNVNQRKAPVGFKDKELTWQGLGNFRLTSGRLTVRLESDASEARSVVLADAVRVQRRDPIKFTRQPEDKTVTQNANASFTVAVTGAFPVTYQWLKNGTRIPDATAATYVARRVPASDSGSRFQCVATNLFGPVPSREATLTVLPAATTSSDSLQR